MTNYFYHYSLFIIYNYFIEINFFQKNINCFIFHYNL
uniref:Uncharacterized protein n=1 Tax=viral metagenome TaxID=1070528 RepID=A0A6C0H5L8_9ZZZZ